MSSKQMPVTGSCIKGTAVMLHELAAHVLTGRELTLLDLQHSKFLTGMCMGAGGTPDHHTSTLHGQWLS